MHCRKISLLAVFATLLVPATAGAAVKPQTENQITGGAATPKRISANKLNKLKKAGRGTNKGSTTPTAEKPEGQRYGGLEFGTPVPVAPEGPVTPGSKAKLASDGTAIAPTDAPSEVQKAIWAANEIIGKPYVYGGGHKDFLDRGYDCSGTVSYALHGGDLLDSPLDSRAFYKYGSAGKGDWITVYTNPGHAYVVIAGLRLDTSGAGARGPKWQKLKPSDAGFRMRHPVDL